ncbi:hypothetical protein MRX96_035144 [Rhipicephalus microplus]
MTAGSGTETKQRFGNQNSGSAFCRWLGQREVWTSGRVHIRAVSWYGFLFLEWPLYREYEPGVMGLPARADRAPPSSFKKDPPAVPRNRPQPAAIRTGARKCPPLFVVWCNGVAPSSSSDTLPSFFVLLGGERRLSSEKENGRRVHRGIADHFGT